jgi:hypothetical protein
MEESLLFSVYLAINIAIITPKRILAERLLLAVLESAMIVREFGS